MAAAQQHISRSGLSRCARRGQAEFTGHGARQPERRPNSGFHMSEGQELRSGRITVRKSGEEHIWDIYSLRVHPSAARTAPRASPDPR